MKNNSQGIANIIIPNVTIVLMPGLDGSGVLFRPLLERLPPEIVPQVITYPATEPMGYAALLPMVMSALPKSGPFVVLGESFSGPLALMIAAQRPSGLCGVILCGTFVRNPLGPRWGWLRHLVTPALFRWHSHLAEAKALLGGYGTPELRRLLREALSQVSPRVLAHRVREVLRVDVRAELQQCPVPVLDIRGTRDNVVRSHKAREVRLLRPDVQTADLVAPHLILQTQPEATARTISEFARKVRV
ncbi:MAG: alpha/beta hydrolase [Planctomycetaceae bacterium]|nr:alpha/beta hydrolase [Planctomycetaceae bacterium]